jgi:hypothetical protein
MSPAEAEARLFGQALVCSEELSYSLVPEPGDAQDRAGHIAAAERLLHSLAGLELPPVEDGDASLNETALQRLDAKLDLILDLLCRVLAREQPPHLPRPLRWSRLGAEVITQSPLVEGERRLLTLELRSGLSLPLRLPVEVLATEPVDDTSQRAWLAFPADSAPLESALERFLFRQHRRQIAAARRHGD